MSYSKIEIRYTTDGLNTVNRGVNTRQGVVKKRTISLPAKVKKYGDTYGYGSISISYNLDHVILTGGGEVLMDTDINGTGNNEYIRSIEGYDWQY